MNLRPAVAVLMFCVLSTSAYALQRTPLPEPGVLELLSIGGIAGVIVLLRKRRRK